MSARVRNYVVLLLALAIVLTSLIAPGGMCAVLASEAGESPTTPVSTVTGSESPPPQNATAITETVTETISITITKTMTFYSVITHTRTTAAMIEYYGPMTFILLFLVMALTVALGFALRKCRRLSSSSST